MKRITLSLAIAVLSGCGTAHPDEAPPEHMIGKYTYQDGGSIAKHPWNVDAALVLERDAQYTLELNFKIADEDEHETSYGTFYVDGDKLILDPADESGRHDITEFSIKGDRLTPKLGWGTRVALKGIKAKPVFVKAD
jgi:uncharacterized protein YceK